ncbi:MAG: hypothetical protein FJX72_05840, partial [Armatimonadetes bacterium]|nr:hypothetical protein [Armatimonadota bacterium]
ARVAERILARMPANTPIMSYPWAAKDVGIGEGPGVTLFAEFGKYLVGSIDCTNLSVHSGIRPGSLRPKPTGERRRYEPGKVYLSFIMSDGDNLPVLTVSNFPQLWADANRGKIPIGWTISPAAWLLMPDVMSYYYATATPNDAFLAAVSGIGYTYPDSYGARYREEDRQAVFDGFLDQTAKYMRESGLRSVWIMNATRSETIRRYAERIPGLEAIYPDYGRRVSEYSEATYPVAGNVGVFHGVTGWDERATRAQKVTRMVEEIRSITPTEKPAFLHAFIWNWGADLGVLRDVLRELGPGYVAVRPDHLAQLYKEDLARRRLLVRAPQSLAAIEGRRLTFSVLLQNVGKQANQVTMAASSGLGDATVEPAQMALQPGEQVSVTLSGMPESDRPTLTVSGSSGRRLVQIPLRRVLESDWVGSAPPAAALRFVRMDEGETLAHAGGRLTADTSATGARSWLVDAPSAKPGYAVFGPYARMERGRYVAVFRVRKVAEGDGQALTVDTCTGGGARITGTVPVAASSLPLDAYRCIAVPFEHPGGDVETRLHWTGSCPVALDWVAVWRVLD